MIKENLTSLWGFSCFQEMGFDLAIYKMGLNQQKNSSMDVKLKS